MTRPIDAVPAESSAGHKPGRDCPCGPVAMRDLATGAVNVWRHHLFLPDQRPDMPETGAEGVRPKAKDDWKPRLPCTNAEDEIGTPCMVEKPPDDPLPDRR